MKLFMHASGVKKTPGHKQKDTDIHLWKQYSKEYYNKRTGDTTIQMSDDTELSMWMSSAGETYHWR